MLKDSLHLMGGCSRDLTTLQHTHIFDICCIKSCILSSEMPHAFSFLAFLANMYSIIQIKMHIALYLGLPDNTNDVLISVTSAADPSHYCVLKNFLLGYVVAWFCLLPLCFIQLLLCLCVFLFDRVFLSFLRLFDLSGQP